MSPLLKPRCRQLRAFLKAAKGITGPPDILRDFTEQVRNRPSQSTHSSQLIMALSQLQATQSAVSITQCFRSRHVSKRHKNQLRAGGRRSEHAHHKLLINDCNASQAGQGSEGGRAMQQDLS